MRFLTFICTVACALTWCTGCFSENAPEYKVEVYQEGQWSDAWVMHALVSDYKHHEEIWNDWDNSKQLRDTMSLALFEDDFDSPVRVRVHTSRPFRKCVVRPTCYEIPVEKIDRNTIEFILPSCQMRKVSVEFDGNRQENLFVVGNRPDCDKPDAETPGVMYFGPGEHCRGTIVVEDNQTVYVDFGAVLYANFIVTGSNVRIAGNGVISGQKQEHWGNSEYACGEMLFNVAPKDKEFLTNFTIENVTLIDSPSWTLSINKVSGIRVENINMVNWILNGDGVDLVCCQDALIKDCLLRCYDDCITMKVNHGSIPDCCNIEIDGCLIWEDIARGIVVGPEAGNAYLSPGRIHSVNIHDCIFLEHRGTSEGDNVRAALSVCQWKHPVNAYGYSTEISNIVCRDLYFDDIQSDGTYIFIWQMPGQTEPSYIRDLTFENIYVNKANRVKNPVFQAITNENCIMKLEISNFNISGEKVLSQGKDFICTGHFDEVSFK